MIDREYVKVSSLRQGKTPVYMANLIMLGIYGEPLQTYSETPGHLFPY